MGDLHRISDVRVSRKTLTIGTREAPRTLAAHALKRCEEDPGVSDQAEIIHTTGEDSRHPLI